MSRMPLRPDSAYSLEQVESFLAGAVIPLRLACHGQGGFPLVASHWFLYGDGELCCAVHQGAVVAQLVAKNPHVGFEIAADTPPYRGVRGAGTATLSADGAYSLLEQLLTRYLSRTDTSLGQWLLSRADSEWVLRIRPAWLTSWDYSKRMA